MSTITTRAGKGSPLTNTELDANFTNLNADKVEKAGTAPVTITANSSSDALRITQIGAGNALVVEDSANPDATPFVIDSAGRVGVGGSPYAGVNLYVVSPITGGTSSYEQINAGSVASDVTAYAGVFESYPATQAAAFTLGQLTHFGAGQGTIGAGSTVNNQYGFNAKATLTGATNNFGFYGDIASGSNRFNFYANGTADNYFNGKVGIGAVPIAGSKLSIAGSTSETSSSSVLSYQTIASASTSSWNGFATFPSTQAAAFTLPILRHYTAGQGTIGAGSTVTNQYGFNVDGSLTGATNNYGFYSNIASGTGRWNFYAGGSAANYFGGSVSSTNFVSNGVASDLISSALNLYTLAGVGGTISSLLLRFVTGANDVSAGTERMRIDSAGNVGIGDVALAYNKVRITGTYPSSANLSEAIYMDGTIPSTTTVLYDGVCSKPSTAAAAFTLASLFNFRAEQGTLGAGSAVTNQYGFFTGSSLTGATNNYGFYSNIASGTGRYNFYAAGTAANYFAGTVYLAESNGNSLNLKAGGVGTNGAINWTFNTDSTVYGSLSLPYDTRASVGLRLNSVDSYPITIQSGSSSVSTNNILFNTSGIERMRINYLGKVGIGSTTLGNVSFRLGNDITGGVSGYGVYSNQTIKSDVTTLAAYFVSAATTDAASFNLTSLKHFSAAQSSIGAGSSVTNQYGFTAESNLSGATNNYGFYSNIAAGTGDWNFYAAGTARNYFSGITGIDAGIVTGAGTGDKITGLYGNTPRNEMFSNDVQVMMFGRFGNEVYGADVHLCKTRSASYSGQTIVQADDQLGNIVFGGSDGTQYIQAASIRGTVDGTPGTNDMPGRITFYTTADGSTAQTERMRIDSAGRVQIGSSGNAGTTLTLTKNITGGTTSQGVWQTGTVQSDVTTTVSGFLNTAATAATAFTLTNYHHFHAYQSALGAGSAITNQYGFYVNQALTGATNNYGVRSDIAAGAGRYNFYAAGSAANYFAGDVQVGTSILNSSGRKILNQSGSILQVVQGTIGSNAFSTSSAGYVATGLSATITPSSTSSKILVIIQGNGRAVNSSGNAYCDPALYRGGSQIWNGFAQAGNFGSTDYRGSITCTYLDSPATTSATTYQLYMSSGLASAVYLNQSGGTSTITLLEISA